MIVELIILMIYIPVAILCCLGLWSVYMAAVDKDYRKAVEKEVKTKLAFSYRKIALKQTMPDARAMAEKLALKLEQEIL